MRLLLLAPRYPPFVGGAELQAQRLARRLDSMGARVTVLTQPCEGQSAEEVDGGVRVLRVLRTLPFGPLWGLSYINSNWRWLRRLREQWDVVHNHQVGLHSWASVRVASELGKPVLLRFAGTGSDGDLSVLSAQRFGKHLVQSLHRASCFVAMTSSGVAEIEQYGLPTDKIRVIPNGVDLERFAIQPWPARDPEEPVRLLFVGRVDANKSLDILLGALATLSRPERFQVRIVGDGPALEGLRAQIDHTGLQSVVELRGARKDVISEYSWSEVVLLLSRFEGMPNVVLEAMACGRPVLGTRIGGIADLVTEGATGWLVPPGDVATLAAALERIETRRPQLSQVGARGRAVAEARYSLQQSALAYMREYERLLVKPPKP